MALSFSGCDERDGGASKRVRIPVAFLVCAEVVNSRSEVESKRIAGDMVVNENMISCLVPLFVSLSSVKDRQIR